MFFRAITSSIFVLVLLPAAAGWGADPVIPSPGPILNSYYKNNSETQQLYRLDVIRYTLQTESEKWELHRQRETFLLQSIAVGVSFLLGFSIFACFMSARRGKLP